MKYIDNYKRDVKQEGIVEKKGQFDYISWAHCEKIANELDEKFNWYPIKNENGNLNHNGMVLIKMIFNGKEREHYYPILDFKNKPINNPTPFDINNAQMRGMSKLFSMMSGIGLSLFTGEDLKIYEKEKTPKVDEDLKKVRSELKLLLNDFFGEDEEAIKKYYADNKISVTSTVEELKEKIAIIKGGNNGNN